ncbi:hypothetical protein DPMN_179814 [Dreissena polymorpha]|uniref:Uncharacterized protein n=1 Tax=Dreissena polymorpha TaxID=45954 RepID=A0A9D4ED21_DREPO|nr:hypothetical protein DPMN_179814 [Dreissena polymorpha]
MGGILSNQSSGRCGMGADVAAAGGQCRQVAAVTTSRYIIGTNLLTKFQEDWKINVDSRVLTRKNAPPPGSHVFQPTAIIFELVQDIIGMNLLTKFHEDRTVNVDSRVLTRFYNSHIRKNAPPLGSHFFKQT